MNNTEVWVALIGGVGSIAALLFKLLEQKNRIKAEQDKMRIEKLQLEGSIESIKKQIVPLQYHPIFIQFDELEHFFAKEFKLHDPGRTLLVQEMVINKIRIWRDILMSYAVDAQQCFNTCDDGRTGGGCNKSEIKMREMLLAGLEKYTDWHRRPGLVSVMTGKVYDRESVDTISIFIPKFHEWHASREEMVRVATQDIPNSGLNNNCYQDYWDVLSIYMFAFIQMKYDAVHTIKHINGDLTGRGFLGITIGSMH